MAILVWLERSIVFFCSLFLTAAFCLVVLLRYGFDSDLFAYEEWVLTVAFLLYFLGSALASHHDVHIKADIVQEYLKPEHAKTLFQGSMLLFEAAIALVLTYYAGEMFFNEFARWPDIPTTPVYKIPLAVPRCFIFLGFALMTLHAFVNGIRQIRAGIRMSRTAESATGSPPVASDDRKD